MGGYFIGTPKEITLSGWNKETVLQSANFQRPGGTSESALQTTKTPPFPCPDMFISCLFPRGWALVFLLPG